MGKPISAGAIKFFEARAISGELAARMGIYTARRVQHGEDDATYEPDAKGDILCFPFIENGEEVNTKYRIKKDGKKLFWQTKGGRKTFFNSDALDDPSLHDGRASLVITEGEPDCMAVVEAGHPWAVSCPDGAPADKDSKGKPIPMRPDSELDPENDPKFEFIFNNWERLNKVKRFILATDNDGPGHRLKDELARRLGRVRCLFIAYPDDEVVPRDDGTMRPCKDLNEVLQYIGADAVREIIRLAKPYPVSGLYTLDDFEPRARTTYSTGFRSLDPYLQLYPGAFVVSSGLPGSGKSAVWTQIAYNMARNHGWRVAIGSFEADIEPDLANMLRAFFIGKRKADWSRVDRLEADAFIREHFCFITRDPSGSADEDCTVQWVVDRAEDALIRYGIDMLLLDPWNELDHRRGKESGADYLNDALRDLKDFGRRRGVCTVCVAHPTKSAGQHQKDGTPIQLYDISDGAAWANKAELGVIVHRASHVDLLTSIFVRKVKFKGTGRIGTAVLTYDDTQDRFVSDGDPEPEAHDNFNPPF